MTQLGRLYEKEKIEYGNQKTKEIAVKMLEEGIDIINEITGLQQEEPATV